MHEYNTEENYDFKLQILENDFSIKNKLLIIEISVNNVQFYIVCSITYASVKAIEFSYYLLILYVNPFTTKLKSCCTSTATITTTTTTIATKNALKDLEDASC